MFYVAAFVLPFLAALQRYAVAYGYEGLCKRAAYVSARNTFIALATLMSVLCLIFNK